MFALQTFENTQGGSQLTQSEDLLCASRFSCALPSGQTCILPVCPQGRNGSRLPQVASVKELV